MEGKYVTSTSGNCNQNSCWSPNLAAAVQIVAGQVQSAFDPSAVTSSPYFVTYDWTTVGVWYSQDGTPGSFEAYGGDGIVAWKQNQPTTTFSAQFFAPGQYLLEVQCVASVYSVYNGSLIASFTQTAYIGGDASDIDMSGGSGGGTAQANGSGGGDGITVVPAVVTFSDTSLIKLGIGAPTAYWKQITATVTPASQVTNVSFGATNGEVSVSVAALNPATGLVYLNIDAVSETPPGTHGASDCNVTANDIGSLVSFPPGSNSVPVIVYKPTSIGRPHDPATTTTYTPTPVPFFFTNQSTPPLTDQAPMGWGICAWVYFVPTKIIVWDQFGEPLDAIYDGAPVMEDGSNLNQKISMGSYTDPLGPTLTPKNLDRVLSPADPLVINFMKGTGPPPPVQSDGNGPVSADYTISINNIQLNPSIVGRTTLFTAPNMITISWP